MKKVLWISILAATLILFCSMPQKGVSQQPPDKVTQLAKKVHLNFKTLVFDQKIAMANAIQQQKDFLLEQPEVQEVTRLKGSNLFVKFKDGNELLMFLGRDKLGSESEASEEYPVHQVQTQKKQFQQLKKIQKPELVRPLLPCAPNSHKALIFDCLEDDNNVITPKICQQVRSNLQALGYSVTVRLNDNANLANAALIDNGEYGVVFMRGHGGDLGGDFGFLVRPWYTNFPPANSGYTGTIRASAYNNASEETQFGYVITGNFSSTYWINQSFPSTVFFLESCHGADPGALPGMPTWTINHGAAVWLGWNESVSFGCGDNGSKLFFDRIGDQENVGAAVAAVFATGCRPPELVTHPAGKDSCRLTLWRSDPNETTAPDSRDFSRLKLVSGMTGLFVTVTFFASPNFDEFFFYVDTGGTSAAEILIRCHSTNFEAFTQTSPGLYNTKIFTGTASTNGNDYFLILPWNTIFGTIGSVKVWFYDMSGKDRLPDSGSVMVKK